MQNDGYRFSSFLQRSILMSSLSKQNQVLALKYRPSRFEDLIGQESISTTLSLALDKNRLSHAYLFSGLRGSGKTSTARIMAKSLVCDNAPTSKPCDQCSGCLSANEGRHIDIVEMDAASNRGIDDIKDLIEHTKYRPTSAKYKVFIIDEVHMLTPQAFNALLKTLEQPPAFVKFILATTDPLKLPATILSRTQHFRFKKISEKNVYHHLVHILTIENIEFEKEALEVLIRSGQGSLRDTLTLLDQAIIYSKGNITTATITEMMGMIDPAFMDKLFTTLLHQGDTREILEELESYEASQVIDEIAIYLKHKMLTRDLRFDSYLFDRFFRILGESKSLLSLNSDSGFVLILTLMKLEEATKLDPIDRILEHIENKEPTPQIQPSYQKNSPSSYSKTQGNILPISPLPDESCIETPQEMTQKDHHTDPALTLYQKVNDLIFERSYELGECFAKSFLFESLHNRTLTIQSVADDKCRLLLKNKFAYIRGYIQDVFGDDIEIVFHKKTPSTETQKELPKSNSLESIDTKTLESNQNTLDESIHIGSMIEDVELGSGCVATMGATIAPNEAQKEISLEEILNSRFTAKAIELFQPETPIRIKSKL